MRLGNADAFLALADKGVNWRFLYAAFVKMEGIKILAQKDHLLVAGSLQQINAHDVGCAHKRNT